MDNKTPIQRVCPSCSTLFTTTSAKHTYCTNACRSSFFRQKNKDKTRDLAQRVQQQNSELNDIKERGVPAAPSTPPPTRAWLEANLPCEAKQALIYRLNVALDQKRRELRAKTGPGWGYFWGLFIGFGLMLIVLSIAYEAIHRKRKRVGSTFWISSGVLTTMVVPLLARLGHWVEQEMRSPAAAAKYQTQVQQLEQEVEALEDELNQEEGRLEVLLRVRDEVARFEASGPPAAPADEEPLPPAAPA